MNIIVRKVAGGYIAKTSTRRRFAKPARTREGAIGNAVMGARKDLGIKRVVWDRKDEWTGRFVKGEANRGPYKSLSGFDSSKLPKADSLAEARALRVEDLSLLFRFHRAIRCAFHTTSGLTLGEIADCAEEELHERSQRETAIYCYRLGSKLMAEVKRLLDHYGLSLRSNKT